MNENLPDDEKEQYELFSKLLDQLTPDNLDSVTKYMKMLRDYQNQNTKKEN